MGDKINVGRYQLGHWNFSIEKKQLHSGEQRVELTGAQTQILALLISQYPATLTSDYLLDNISAQHQITKNKLYQGIAKLRKVFEDSAHKGQFIETVPKLGYRLTIAPLVDITDGSAIEQPLSQSTEPTDIFADLSFIQSEEPVVQPLKLPLERRDSTMQNVEPSKRSSIERKQSNSVTKPALIVSAIIVSVGFIVVQALQSTPEVTAVSPYPEQIFIAPATYTIMDEITKEQLEISSFNDLNQNLQWWFNQQLQHLPIIKVITKDAEGFPRLLTHITYHQDFLEVAQSYLVQAESTAINLSVFHLNYTEQLLTQRIDPQLLQYLVGDVTIDVGNDSCSFNQLTSSIQIEQVIESSCLAQYYQQFKFLLADIETTDTRVIIEKLEQLSIRLLKRFPVNSLGYQVKAKAALLLGDTAMGKQQYHNAIELNGSDVDNFNQLASLYRASGDYQQSVSLL
ncbi:MAG: winged helix-turn-helix domain-containing protein, partial [Gammaproteobacteria bacterium]|nr:winged helix-turn-helix domain-containing protein [Gammaproteobacteria bacterium]